MSTSEPLAARPIGERAVATMTASGCRHPFDGAIGSTAVRRRWSRSPIRGRAAVRGWPAADDPRPPAAPADRLAGTSVAATSVPGWAAAFAAARATGRARRAERSGRLGVGVNAERVQHRRKQRIGRLGVPLADGWNWSSLNRSSRLANTGPRMSPSDTARPPASTTVIVWAAARLRDIRRTSARSGWRSAGSCRGPGRCRPRPRPPSPAGRVRAAARWRTASLGLTRWVTSLAPITITAISGGSDSPAICSSSVGRFRRRPRRRWRSAPGWWATADSPLAIVHRRRVDVAVYPVAGGQGVAQPGHRDRIPISRHAGRGQTVSCARGRIDSGAGMRRRASLDWPTTRP